jgi:hydroxymethylpyrimidine/phosphomethylpyrimidine kinase
MAPPSRTNDRRTLPVTLTIAGNDPSGGAGLQADVKTFESVGAYGMGVLTLATDCTTDGVDAVEPLPDAFVARQIDRVCTDIAPDAVKTGLLFDTAIIEAVLDAVEPHGLTPLVVDPVMTSRHGERLLSDEAEAAMRRLVGRALITTPSYPEAERLSGLRVASREDAVHAARRIHERLGPTHVVVTGGHAKGDTSADAWFDGETVTWLEAERQPYAMHGAGDALSAALTVGLADGRTVDAALRRAKAYVDAAIRHAPPRGHGHRPLAHDAGRRALADTSASTLSS